MSTGRINSELRVGVVGATGVVGMEFLKLLSEWKIKPSEIRCFASSQSAGKSVFDHPVEEITEDRLQGLDIVFFSSGEDVSSKWAPIVARLGGFAIDNSSAFRLNPEVPLVVPEVNGEVLQSLKKGAIIANPNCSTIQLVVALQPLKKFGLKRVIVSSYQAVSGAGRDGLDQLAAERSGQPRTAPSPFVKEIDLNCIPQIGSFDAEGFSSEEQKIRKETKKILGLPDLQVSAFTVRVPVMNAHAESVWVTLESDPGLDQVQKSLLEFEPHLVFRGLQDGHFSQKEVSGQDPVFVSRLRKEPDMAATYSFWVVADNLKKGAALNGLQIAATLDQRMANRTF